MSANELIATVKKISAKWVGVPLKSTECQELALAAPVLARMLEKAIEQRNHFITLTSVDESNPLYLDNQVNACNAKLDRIAEGKE